MNMIKRVLTWRVMEHYWWAWVLTIAFFFGLAYFFGAPSPIDRPGW